MSFEFFKNAKNTISKNKLIFTITLFFVWIVLFDSNSWIDRRRLKKERDKLKNEKEFYLEKIRQDSTSLEELRTNPENLEKFARENFFMKKDNEEIFVIVEEEQLSNYSLPKSRNQSSIASSKVYNTQRVQSCMHMVQHTYYRSRNVKFQPDMAQILRKDNKFI